MRHITQSVSLLLVWLALAGLLVACTRPAAAPATALSPGGTVSLSALVDSAGHQIPATARWTLLVSVDPDASGSMELARYVNVLRDHYSEADLAIIGLAHGPQDRLAATATQAHLKYKVASAPADLLAMVTNPVWVCVLDASHVVRFVESGVEPSAVRMLVERFVTGEVNYAPAAGHHRLVAGDPTPSPDVLLVSGD